MYLPLSSMFMTAMLVFIPAMEYPLLSLVEPLQMELYSRGWSWYKCVMELCEPLTHHIITKIQFPYFLRLHRED